MINLDNLPRHPLVEKVVDNLVIQTGSNQPDWFRVMTVFHFTKAAASMRAVMNEPAQQPNNPVNIFAFAFAPSGFGKGKSEGLLGGVVLDGFRERFNQETMPVIAEDTMWDLAVRRAVMTGNTENEEMERYAKFYRSFGPAPFTFKGATAPSIQQLRQKLLLAGAGAITLQIDELGLNLGTISVTEGLSTFLELYERGKTEISMTMNTSERERLEPLPGFTPACFLGFGEPSKVFDGAAMEKAFMELLATGYARRALIAWGERTIAEEMSPEELLDFRINAHNSSDFDSLRSHFTALADPMRLGWTMEVPRYTTLIKTSYELLCKKRASEIINNDTLLNEMEHRHSKALKIAGALAFVDQSAEIAPEHYQAAMGMVEESGEALHKIFNRDQPHVRLAKYIAQSGNELTHADLAEEFPFCRSSKAINDQLIMAQAWGYKNHTIIRRRFEDSIELIEGETLQETDLERMILSISGHVSQDYQKIRIPFTSLEELGQVANHHWTNHYFEHDVRRMDNLIPGFNMVVVDVDQGISLESVHDMLSDYTFLTYTTKRHTPDAHRFRLILPINYILELKREEYVEFMKNLSLWLPFEMDSSSMEPEKKWLTSDNNEVFINEGKLLDALPFIPRTTRHEEFMAATQNLHSLDALERFFAQRMIEGDRNNQMIKYAYALCDTGMDYSAVEAQVLDFNRRLSNGLPLDELRATVLVSAARKVQELRDKAAA